MVENRAKELDARSLEAKETQVIQQTDKQTLVGNRNYKDTVFRMLFREKKHLLSLYNAMNDKHYTDEDALQIITLENAIYMEMKNDLAFLLDTNLYLYEHQSTKNPNMPLRNLFYISKEYQKLVEHKSLYSTVIQKIPTPRFIVFYNGTDEMEDRSELLLSSAYETKDDNPDLELRVTVLNVNSGHNRKLLESCPILNEYALYVEKVREFASRPGVTLDQAVEQAVNECIEQEILREFLLRNKAEAIAMSIFEYNKEEEIKKYRRAEREGALEEGREEGRKEGREEGRKEGREEGRKEGREEGRKEGRREGREEGAIEKQRESLLKALSKKGNVSATLRNYIEKEDNLEVLEGWFDLALTVENIETFEVEYVAEK